MYGPALRGWHLTTARLAAALTLYAVAATLYGAWNQGWTIDEHEHLKYSARLIATGETERRSDPFFDSKTPINVPNILAQRAGLALGAGDTEGPKGRFAARSVGVLWLLALITTVVSLASTLGGPAAGAMAAMAMALEPNLIAHASVATTDLPFATLSAATVLAAWRLFRHTRESSWRRTGVSTGLLGLAFGGALTAKFSAILLLPLLLVAPWLSIPRPTATELKRGFLLLSLAIGIALLVLEAAYGFDAFGSPFRIFSWQSPTFRLLALNFPFLRLPFPDGFLTGIDACIFREGAIAWPVILLNHSYPGGVAWYFPVLWTLKTPLPLAIAELTGLWLALRNGVFSKALARLLLVAFIVPLCYFSFCFRTQIGFRYALLCIPFAVALAAAGLAELRHKSYAPLLLTLGLLATLGETLPYWGQPLAFTSSLVYPKRDAFRFVADSNLDWDQNGSSLWQSARSLGFTPGWVNPLHPLPGRNTFSGNELSGVSVPFERHRWLRTSAEPGGHFLFTWFWFDVSDDLFDRFLRENRHLPSTLASAALCSQGESDKLATARPLIARQNTEEHLCLAISEPTNVSFEGISGDLWIGPSCPRPECRVEQIHPGQQAWWKLDPGSHVFVFRSGGPAPAVGRIVPHARDLMASLVPANPGANSPGRSTSAEDR